jgi:hypothetical protein
MSHLSRSNYSLPGKVKSVKKCPHESFKVSYNAMFSENRWHGHIFSYVLSNYNYLWCVLTLWFNLRANFNSLITNRNFPALPRNFRDRLTSPNCPLFAIKFNYSIILKFQSDLAAWKFDHKICMEDSKFISSGFLE